MCTNVAVHGGVIGGDDECFTRSRLGFLESGYRTSPGEGGGIDESHELRDEATDSVESVVVWYDLEVPVGVMGS